MSALDGLTILAAAGLDLISAVMVRPRYIDSFVADITVEELGTDELAITQHPVEQGASITDHSAKLPARVTLKVGYSNSSIWALGDPNYVQDVYEQFLNLQASRSPFDVLTGKRLYSNMLIQRLSAPTDEKTENALILTIDCREIIIVDTQVTSGTSGTTANMASPQNNATTQQQGTTQLQPASNFNTAGMPAVVA